MNSFLITQTLATHTRFTVFEARGERFQFPVVLKRCEYREASEAEFFIRSALMKTKAKRYSQPLLSIFADVVEGKSLIVFVWKKGGVLDVEVEVDEEPRFPSGKAGFGKSKVLYKNPLTREAVKRALCLTLGKKVVLKISKHERILGLNSVLEEALVQVKCAHPNVCDFLDFRLFLGKSGLHNSYIVMESLKKNLVMEMQEREFQPYDEIELVAILQRVIAALLNAKHQNLTYQDIRPHNILRGPQGLKLAAFGSTCLEGPCPRTSSSTEMYISPEDWEAMGDPKMQQRSFESNVFSLGMTMLHLAETKLPERTPAMSFSELQALLQREVQALRYSEELKRLLAAMLSAAPSDRPPLEAVQVDAGRIYQQATQTLAPEALRLALQARLSIDEGKSAEGFELAAAAHAFYSRLLGDKNTANNLRNLATALREMGSSAEAVEKYAEAHAIYSRLPEDKDTAINLKEWGDELWRTAKNEEAVEKYAVAHAISSRLAVDKDTPSILKRWGDALRRMERGEEAMEKYAAACAINSRLPEDKDTANFMKELGDALMRMGRSEEAMEKYAAAHDTYSRLPEDKDTASFLMEWGDALREMKRSEEAAEKYAAAHAIYSRLPEDKDTASFLKQWDNALMKMRRSEAAMKKYTAARAICSRLSEDKDTARFLIDFGDELRKMRRSEEAMEKYAAAYAICSRLPEDKDTASFLKELGEALMRMGRSEEAMEKYAEAYTIYSRLPVSGDTASFLKELGDALREMGRSEEAMEKHAVAHAIYSRLSNVFNVALNLKCWGITLREMGRNAEAMKKYVTANHIISRLPVSGDTASFLKELGDELSMMGRDEEAVEKYEASRAAGVLSGIYTPSSNCDDLIARLI